VPEVNLEKHGKIYYIEKGSSQKDTIILLHGLGNRSISWKKQLDLLGEDYHVIAWDAPGYGESDDPDPWLCHFSEFADILYEFVETLKLKNIFLLGHSMGAAIAIDFTYRYPEKVRKLIIAAPTRGGAFIDEATNKSKLENRLHAVNKEGSVKLARDRTENLFSSHASKELIKKSEKIMQQVRPAGYSSVAYSLYNLNQKEIYSRIRTPTLVICGEEDRVTPVPESEYIHQQIPQSELILLSKAGHVCFLEQAESFRNSIVCFLKKT